MMMPDAALSALEQRRADFEQALAPCRVVFDVRWPRASPPIVGVGFEFEGRRHALEHVAVDECAGKLVDYVRDHREELLAKVGASRAGQGA